MKNLNSDSEFYEGKEKNVYEYFTHRSMPKIRYKRRRRPDYRGVVNIMEPVKPKQLKLMYKKD